MIKAVIFDLDGLLIDSEVISYKIYKELLEEFGHDYSLEEYAQNYSGKTEIANVTNLIDKYKLPLSLERGLEIVMEKESSYLSKGVDLKAGAVKLLSYLKDKGFKIAMASSSKEDRALNILRKHNISEYFDIFVFGNEVKRGKPNPDIFLKACEKLSLKAEEALVLEDSEAGIKAAYFAKIPVICIPDMKMPSKEHLSMTTRLLNSLDEVINYIEGYN
ncbi:HAD family hydrolase [Clostridium isatidis]|uniref:HAD family hydrolase n=1 Tax=Clostridium isatidis TaxID=182773 RepID=UPI001A9A3685|nr:HAD family phosphatase [Clostridium isatidis]